ncbi:MAG: serine hydrolase [Campylobacterales bacterium]
MKRLIRLFILPLIASPLLALSSFDADDYPVGAFVIKEVGAKREMAAKNEDLTIAPASLTKIMTAILAIESNRLYDTVTIPYEATRVEPTRAGLRVGEVYRLIDLVMAAMIESDNDAAMAIGLYLGKTQERFAQMMNAKARQLGMHDTHFTNPCGFDWGDHRSTARDLLTLTEYAIKNPIFNQIAQMERATIQELTTGRMIRVTTHNRLLTRYKYAVGIKTGYTSKAGPCLIARAKREGKDLILVMLHAKADRWRLAGNLFDRSFAQLGLDTEDDDHFTQQLYQAQTNLKPATRAKLTRAAMKRGLKLSSMKKKGRLAKKSSAKRFAKKIKKAGYKIASKKFKSTKRAKKTARR